MKNIVRILVCLSFLLGTSAQAYCIYNKTTGMDSLNNHLRKRPTLILVKPDNYPAFTVRQGKRHCNTHGPRRENDQSTLLISWVKRQYVVTSICLINIYNKGGYVIIKGSHGNYTCNVYRDPN